MNINAFLKKHIHAILLLMTAPLLLASCSGYPGKKNVNAVFKAYDNVRPGKDASAAEIMMHIYGNGGSALLDTKNAKETIQAVGWFGSVSGINGWIQLYPDTSLPHFVERTGGKIVEPDPNMFLAIFADTNLDRKKILLSTTSGESPDLELMLSTAMYYFNPSKLSGAAGYIPGGQNGNAAGWTLAALADYELTESEWKNNTGFSSDWEAYNKQKADPKAFVMPAPYFSMRDLISISLERPMTWGPYSGLNENYGIARALRRHRIAMAKDQDQKSKNKSKKTDPFSIKLTGEWKSAQERLDEVIAAAKKNQFDDGSFSSSWAAEKKFEKDAVKRAIYTARMLDVMTQTLSEKQLKEPWVLKTVRGLSKLLLANRDEISKDAFAAGYALHALRSYRDRMPGAALTTAPPCTDQAATCPQANEKQAK